MLKIQVLGSGLIPRGYGLAPRKAPFPADLTLIQTILATQGLKVNYQREDGVFLPLTRKNVADVWNAHHAEPKTTRTRKVVESKTPGLGMRVPYDVKVAEDGTLVKGETLEEQAAATQEPHQESVPPIVNPEPSSTPVKEETPTPPVPTKKEPNPSKEEKHIEKKEMASPAPVSEEKTEEKVEEKTETKTATTGGIKPFRPDDKNKK